MATMNLFLDVVLNADAARRDEAVEITAAPLSLDQLLEAADGLDAFWPETDNLYERVRVLIILYYLHRFEIPARLEGGTDSGSINPAHLQPCPIPLPAHRALQSRKFSEAIRQLLALGIRARVNRTLSTGLSSAYHGLALQFLADQVKRSVRGEPGNQWMFRIGHPDDHPLTVRRELASGGWLVEETAVRMDLSHSSWSDIFFLGMDRPAFAKVINASVDLVVRGQGEEPRPPCLSAIRIIDRPVIRLVSLDLGAEAEISELVDLFDFGKDYLGLLKAALIASGVVPPGLEGSRAALSSLLSSLVGPGKGLELVSWVKEIPKGSRLAVSTNLLGGLISVCMRATSQTRNLEGPLTEEGRRIVASRAILGEWLGGSGGGWQDSGGVWPGIKLIEGCWEDGSIAQPMLEPASSIPDRDRVRMGALLPRHTRLDPDHVSAEALQALENSLIVVHGGMAANVGPILEMVTERYLLRSGPEWAARADSLDMTRRMLDALQAGAVRELGELTTRHFFGPLKTIIPWASNAFTEALISTVATELEALGGSSEPLRFDGGDYTAGSVFWGFWMLGGMSGGGMGFIVHPDHQAPAKEIIQQKLLALKQRYEASLPFAMDPVIYDFRINRKGTSATFLNGSDAHGDFLREYFRLRLPRLLQLAPRDRTALETADLQKLHEVGMRHAATFLGSLLPDLAGSAREIAQEGQLDAYLGRFGFDREAHERIREDLRKGRLGLAQNRLHPKTRIDDVDPAALMVKNGDAAAIRAGEAALANGECAVITLAAGAGSRWTKGAGVVKALHPFAPMVDGFRSFLEIHLGKTRATSRQFAAPVAHIITTSYLTHPAIARWAEAYAGDALDGIQVHLSEGRSIGLRLIPTRRDLHYAWFELPQDKLDEQAEKMRDSVRQSLMRWAEANGEAADYRDNLPTQCLHPVGHWYELPNIFLNGTLVRLLEAQPNLSTLLMHNIDTLGASLDPELLGKHLLSGADISFEVMQRCFSDVGGGLASIDQSLRLIEGFALPREEDEFKLSYYNSLTNWISLDRLLERFGLQRDWFASGEAAFRSRLPVIQQRVREVASELPTYITLKEAKKRWGRGQEDVYPVTQFERLWGDMSAWIPLNGGKVGYFLVDRRRGLQLKDPDELDALHREGIWHG